ncbi:MAG TPA: hypothetical protein VIS06_14420, partial [Mycobacteriales bacterium]
TEPALTGHDVTVGGPPTGTAPTAGAGADHRIRPGDVLVPTVSRAVVARVATDEQVGALAGGHVHVVRVDPQAFDPRFVAGVLASVRNARRAARVATSTSDTLRIDVRRLRIPVLPIEAQRVYGEAFARITEFDATVDQVADQGRDLARALTQGLIGGVLQPDV